MRTRIFSEDVWFKIFLGAVCVVVIGIGIWLYQVNKDPGEVVNNQAEWKCTKKDVARVVDKTMKISNIEDKLVRILVKMDEKKCRRCSKKDKKVILQLKMMHSIRMGEVEDAQEYLSALNKYM